MNPGKCDRPQDLNPPQPNLPGNVNDCFYQYEPLDQKDIEDKNPAYFGHKVRSRHLVKLSCRLASPSRSCSTTRSNSFALVLRRRLSSSLSCSRTAASVLDSQCSILRRLMFAVESGRSLSDTRVLRQLTTSRNEKTHDGQVVKSRWKEINQTSLVASPLPRDRRISVSRPRTTGRARQGLAPSPATAGIMLVLGVIEPAVAGR